MVTVVAYDNTTTSNGSTIGGSPPREIGNEISLAVNTPRYVSEFSFGYVATAGLTGTVRFYMKDSPDGAPGTLYYESDPFRFDSSGRITLSLSHFIVPNVLIWTVAYSGPTDAGFGLLGFGPPTVGQSVNFIWYAGGDSAWFKQDFISPLNARLTASELFRHPGDLSGLAPIATPPTLDRVT
jgi:hypothetical protein